MNSQFIEFLYNRKTSFPAPEEARDKAKACDLLSKDIYKDSTRFAYELLQNADDASCSTNNLDFQIDFCGDYLIVSHKGKRTAYALFSWLPWYVCVGWIWCISNLQK